MRRYVTAILLDLKRRVLDAKSLIKRRSERVANLIGRAFGSCAFADSANRDDAATTTERTIRRTCIALLQLRNRQGVDIKGGLIDVSQRIAIAGYF